MGKFKSPSFRRHFDHKAKPLDHLIFPKDGNDCDEPLHISLVVIFLLNYVTKDFFFFFILLFAYQFFRFSVLLDTFSSIYRQCIESMYHQKPPFFYKGTHTKLLAFFCKFACYSLSICFTKWKTHTHTYI